MKHEESDSQTYAIIGAAMEVHRVLKRGFLEAAYQEALAIEFELRGIRFQREVDLPIVYKDRRLNTRYRADFIVYDDVIVELKAQSALTGVDASQLLNYLNATGIHRGLLLNFGTTSLETKRLVL